MVTLEGVNAKVQRAQDEIEQLAKDISVSCETQRALFSEELRPDVGDKIWIFRGETPIVPIEYSVRLGEIVYNLRSALDQLVWQLVHANYKTPGRHNEFPILDDESRFNEAVKSKLKGVSQESSDKIKEMQPFRENDKWDALKTLHSLCNIDKHRSVILPFYSVDRYKAIYHGGGDPDIKPHVHFIHASELRKDSMSFSVRPADAIFDIALFVDMKLSGSDSLDIKKYMNVESDKQQVILVLRDCLSTVRSAVDYLSAEIQKHPLFGKRPPLLGLQSVDLERPSFIPQDVYEDSMPQFFKDLEDLLLK